jgi:putative addiction module CopG family antidote
MTIHLPEDLERFVRSEVSSGRFASEDDAITAAVRLLQQSQQAQTIATIPIKAEEETAPTHKPIWEALQEISATIPDEVWEKMPVDSSEQHDHYIYGTPKRPKKP